MNNQAFAPLHKPLLHVHPTLQHLQNFRIWKLVCVPLSTLLAFAFPTCPSTQSLPDVEEIVNRNIAVLTFIPDKLSSLWTRCLLQCLHFMDLLRLLHACHAEKV